MLDGNLEEFAKRRRREIQADKNLLIALMLECREADPSSHPAVLI